MQPSDYHKTELPPNRKIMAYMKPVRGAKKVGDHCFVLH